MKKNILLFILPLFFMSCDKPIKSEKGAVDIISNIYFNASKGLGDHKQFYISKINYLGDDIIELVPNIQAPELIDSVFYITDNVFFKPHTYEDAKSIIFTEEQFSGSAKSIYKKKFGAVWVNIPIFDYDKRKDIADTILYNNKKTYKRFEINTPENYSVYYLHPTDTIIPYSLNPIADKAYNSRLERIDSYDKKKDLFSTIW
ncbi:hypothetical protein EON73_05455, partial [bacterium]